jgi:hypothetical protein
MESDKDCKLTEFTNNAARQRRADVEFRERGITIRRIIIDIKKNWRDFVTRALAYASFSYS